MNHILASLRRSLLLVGLGLLATSCVYGKVIFPLDTDVNHTQLGSKVGHSSAQSVLWMVAWGDAGVEAAAREGGIQTVQHLDVERYVLLFGLYMRVTTIAYGD